MPSTRQTESSGPIDNLFVQNPLGHLEEEGDDDADKPPSGRIPLPSVCPVELRSFLEKREYHAENARAYLDAAIQHASEDLELLLALVILFMNRFFVVYSHTKFLIIQLGYTNRNSLHNFTFKQESVVKSSLSNLRMQVPWLRGKTVPVFELFKQDVRRNEVRELRFVPDGPLFMGDPGQRVLNTYRGILSLTPRPNEPPVNSVVFEPILTQLRRLSGADADVAVPYILDVLAWILQHKKKPQVAFVFVSSTKGVGKSLLLTNMMMHFFGEHNSATFSGVKSMNLASGFNDAAADRMYLFVDEAGAKLSVADRDALKEHVTGDTLLVRRKYCDTVKYKDNSLIALAANQTPEGLVEAGDRRYLLVEAALGKPSKEELEIFAEAVRNPRVWRMLARWLLERNVSHFGTEQCDAPPLTKAMLVVQGPWIADRLFICDILRKAARGNLRLDHLDGVEGSNTWWEGTLVIKSSRLFELFEQRNQVAYTNIKNHEALTKMLKKTLGYGPKRSRYFRDSNVAIWSFRSGKSVATYLKRSDYWYGPDPAGGFEANDIPMRNGEADEADEDGNDGADGEREELVDYDDL